MNKFSYDLPKDLYKGMRVRPSMDMIANMIEKDPYKIKYPDRDATFYLNSPQFLSILQDTNVGLAEQSKQLTKRQFFEAQARMSGRGGAVDLSLDRNPTAESGYETASSGGGGVNMAGDETLRRLNLEARARRLAEEQARLLEQQERRRIEEERRLYEEFEQQRRLEREKRRQAQAMTSQIIVGSFGTHPVAQQAAQQRQQFVAVTPEMFQQYMDQLRRNS